MMLTVQLLIHFSDQVFKWQIIDVGFISNDLTYKKYTLIKRIIKETLRNLKIHNDNGNSKLW